MTVRVHGIGSCDSCRKARLRLDQAGIVHDWVDLRETPPAPRRLEHWIRAIGPGALVNRRSTSWRQLSPAEREAADGAGLVELLQAHPTLIKRPLIERGDTCRVGFGDTVIEWLQSS